MIDTNVMINEKILEIGGKRSQVPVHMLSYHMYVLEQIFNNGKNIYITPKVDGVLTNFEYCGMLFECEKLDNNMFLIDVLNNVKYQSLYTRFKMLESIFKTQILHTIKSENDVKNILNKYYINNFSKKDSATLVIKPIFIVNNKNSEHCKFHDMLSYITCNNFDYKTDGWIIYADNMQTTKLKPQIHMTIDVEYYPNDNTFMSSDKFLLNNVKLNNNLSGDTIEGIYRCYYSDEQNMWIAKEKRDDKIRGNKYGTISTVEAIYKNYHANFPDVSNLQPYYFDNTNNNKRNKTESHEIRNTCLDDVVKLICLFAVSVLDMGCGNGSLYYKLSKDNKNVFYTGIDVDPYILTKTPLGGHYLWQSIDDIDVECLLKLSSNRNFEVPYDVVTFIHSLHFCNDIQKLFDKLKCLTKTVLIVGIFEDYFVGDFELNDVKVKKQLNGNYDFYYKWKDHKITDKLLKNSNFTNLNEWKITKQKQYIHETNEFINMHQLLILSYEPHT